MSYKTLLTHVEASETGRKRLRQTVKLAQRFDARVIGVGARLFDPLPDPTGLSAQKLREAISDDLAACETIFRQETSGLSSAVQWRMAAESPTRMLLSQASGADLIVCGADPDPPEMKPDAAELIMAAGAPVLVAPRDASLDARTVVVGWKDVREARRAVWDALPLLKAAERVVLIRFAAEDAPAPAMQQAVERLQLHGVRVEAELRQRRTPTVAADLVAAAQTLNAGLIVTGGYGHSRLQEWALGGVTQGLLAQRTMSVLFSH